jgi:hypothetical protein
VDIAYPGDLNTFGELEPFGVTADAYDVDGSIARVDFYAANRWIGRDLSSPFHVPFGPLPAGTYIVTAVATDNSGATAMTRPVRILVRPALSVPSPWQIDDIGAVAGPGYATGTASAMTVQGSGADVWGTADAFSYVHQPLAGDGVMIARVASIEGVAPWTKVGIMMRESLSADSAHAFIVLSAGKGVAFQRRTIAGGPSTHTGGSAATAPHWVRIARTGATITAAASPDGVA